MISKHVNRDDDRAREAPDRDDTRRAADLGASDKASHRPERESGIPYVVPNAVERDDET